LIFSSYVVKPILFYLITFAFELAFNKLASKLKSIVNALCQGYVNMNAAYICHAFYLDLDNNLNPP